MGDTCNDCLMMTNGRCAYHTFGDAAGATPDPLAETVAVALWEERERVKAALAAAEAERDALRQLNADLHKQRDEWQEQADQLQREVEKLKAQVESLRADADRHRALCYDLFKVERIATLEAALREARGALEIWADVATRVPVEHLPREHMGGITLMFHNRALDAIDAALGPQQGKGEP